MKIGFVVHFFDFRNDVRRVVQEVALQHEVVLFVRREDAETVRSMMNGQVAIRVVNERIPSFFNRVWDQLFRFFGRLPRSVRNFYLMEYFKISLDERPGVRAKAFRMLALAMKLPKLISYDRYLDNITYRSGTDINDIDQFICFTDISDSYLFARLLRERRNVKVYVYSWDHPCKQVKFSRKATYLVWHEGIRKDMMELQHMPASQMKVVGASQFAYIHHFLNSRISPGQRPYPFKYIYFGCAIGIPLLARQEAALVARLSRLMEEAGSRYQLVVRPYPVLKDWSVYDILRGLPNVVFDDAFRTANLSVGEDHIYEKYVKIHFADAFLHLGTTMGLEACFTQTPSFIVDFPEFAQGNGLLTLANFVHQYQNDKYLMAGDSPNIVRTERQFLQQLETLYDTPEPFLSYNRQVTQGIPLKSFADFAHDLISV